MRVVDARSPTVSTVNSRIFLQDNDMYIGSRPPAPARKSSPSHDGGSFGVVWVNPIGRQSMTAAKPGSFPAGSVIVREKFTGQNDLQPELLAVMIKRAAGFSPKTGDWEYLIVNGGLTKIRERQKRGSCSACHASQKDTDFVFPQPQIK